MRIAVTGASGIVGRFLAEAIGQAGHQIDPLPGWRLGQPAPLAGCDALIHAAFAHEPGRYRGGEGDDPARFVALNQDGTLRLWEDARAAGVGQVVFLSSRAVHDGWPAGTPLPDGTPPRAASLYGQVKIAGEAALAALSGPGFRGASLRATGVYGLPLRAPGGAHKWTALFRDWLAGRPVAPRVATELHGADLAAAALRLVAAEASGAFHASDLTLDRHDLLAEVARRTGCAHPLPARADAGALSVMGCARLAALGWRPGGWALLRAEMPRLLPDRAEGGG